MSGIENFTSSGLLKGVDGPCFLFLRKVKQLHASSLVAGMNERDKQF